MPPTEEDKSEFNPPALGRNGFEEPTISEPLDLAGTGARGPIMALIALGSVGGGVDAGGFPPDGLGGDGYANLDGSLGGPGPDGVGSD